MRTIMAFWADTRGATSIEYAIIAGGIFLAIVVAVQSIGPKLSSKFLMVSGNLT